MNAASPACPGCEGETTRTFLVEGMCCATEATLVEDRLRAIRGVCSVQASAVTGKATVTHTVEVAVITRALEAAGFRARPAEEAVRRPAPSLPTLAALGLTVAGAVAGWFSPVASVAFYLPAILVGGGPIAVTGLRRARQGALDMNVLMTVAVAGAMTIGEWGEAASTVVLFSVAQLLEARSLERARRAISGLMRLAPDTARVLRAGGEERVAAGAVARGEEMVVGPGERVALDGVVRRGASEVDQSPLTGESQPAAKQEGDEVFAGSINGAGVLIVRVTRAASETTLARLMRRVEEARSSRAASQGFVESFARVYTPAVVVLAAAVALVPPLLGQGAFFDWTYRALVLLVIACPCALVISTPVSIVSALTAASRAGVLVKGGAHLEEMGQIGGVVFDKTGTLTRGEPVVVDVLPAPGHTRADLLRLASAVEAHAGHPVAEAVVARARAEGVDVRPAEATEALPGRGARGRVGGQWVLVGSHRLFDERGLCDHRLDDQLARIEAEGKTAVLVGVEGGAVIGVLGVGDALRDGAVAAVDELRRMGLHVALLTGDNARTAHSIARTLGITEAWADLLPDDKVARVRELKKDWGLVAMVGDGVNDAPALATADVGIAMGRRGTDVALETADVVLMHEQLARIPYTVRLGRLTRTAIRNNIAVSLAVKAVVLGLALLGHGSLWAAVAADMGASLLVIGNGMRLLAHEPAVDQAGHEDRREGAAHAL